MTSYDELLTRAEAKGIRTFGDALRALRVDGQDVWGSDYTDDMQDEPLYNCDEARHLLASLAEVQHI